MLFKKLQSLSEISKLQLLKILNDVPDPKDLVFEASIIKPLERICGVRWLRSNKVEKLFKLDNTHPNTEHNIVYVIYSSFNTFKNVVDQVRSRLSESVKNTYYIIVIPNCLYIYEDYLEELGISGIIKLYSMQWQPIYLDKGLISLEQPHLFKPLFIDSDLSYLSAYAKSLWHLQFVIGKPKNVLALGQYANAAIKQLEILNENLPKPVPNNCDIGALILMDRNIDYTSCFLTPTVYSALLNDIYNVESGVCEYKIVENDPNDTINNKCVLVVKKEPIRIVLDEAIDSIYKDIKNKHFSEVITILKRLTQNLRSESESSKEMALDEIRKYVQTKLQATTSKKKLVVNHLHASQSIVNCLGHRFEEQQQIEQFIMQNKNKNLCYEYLEKVLVTENDKLVTLRLLCLILMSLKLTVNEFNSIYIKFLHEFGYRYGFVQNNLYKIGFINEDYFLTSGMQNFSINIASKIPKFSANDFYSNISRLKQIPNDRSKINLKTPNCCSYVFGGNYIPLIAQISSLLINNTPWTEIKTKLEPLAPLTIKNEKNITLHPKTLLVYVIGGITYAEIAACNLLAQLTDTNIVVCSDVVISGNSLMNNILEI